MSKRLSACITALLCLALAAIVSATATCQDVSTTGTRSNVETIEVQRLVIKDGNGQTRIELTVQDDCPQIVFRNAYGHVILVISARDRYEYEIRQPALGDFYPDDVVLNFDSLIPTWYQWDMLDMIARLNTSGYGLTERLHMTAFNAHFDADAGPNDVRIRASVNTETQPGWNYHMGQGRFSISDREVRSAYQEAGEAALKAMNIYFPYDGPQQVAITFRINGYLVGEWHNGVMKLAGE